MVYGYTKCMVTLCHVGILWLCGATHSTIPANFQQTTTKQLPQNTVLVAGQPTNLQSRYSQIRSPRQKKIVFLGRFNELCCHP